jgi:hypothetical protein
VQVAPAPTVLSKDGTSGEFGRPVVVWFTNGINGCEIEVDDPPPSNVLASTGTSRIDLSVPKTLEGSQRRSVAALPWLPPCGRPHGQKI